MRVHLKAPWELAVMRANGRRLAEVAAMLRETIAVGASTLDLDRLAEEKVRSMGAHPSFKGYSPPGTSPYPSTLCTSVNDEVIHGIPSNRPLEDGDVLSVDMGLHYGGYHADMAFTVVLGKPSKRIAQLLDVTRKSLYIGIAQAKSGQRIGDIGYSIESTIRPHRFGIVRQFVGHGIGRALHERPSVPNYGKAKTGDLLKPGMCIAIEPMVTLGTWKTKILQDGWTVVTTDSSISAHFEHTIAITENGPELLTTLDEVDQTIAMDPIIR
jgi:methionyl aminopeptidase